MPAFVCPSNGNQLYQSRRPTRRKAPSRTTRQWAPPAASLTFAANQSGTIPYGSGGTIHPDGAIYPGTGSRAADIQDGQSHTIFIIETIDDKMSRWLLGAECTLTGLPGKGKAYVRANSQDNAGQKTTRGGVIGSRRSTFTCKANSTIRGVIPRGSPPPDCKPT